MPSAGAIQTSLPEATIAVEGRFNSSCQTGIKEDTARIPASPEKEAQSLLFAPAAVVGDQTGKLVGSGTTPVLGCRLKVSPGRAFQHLDGKTGIPHQTPTSTCLLGSPKFTSLGDSYLVPT